MSSASEAVRYDDGFCRMYVGDAIDVLSELPEKSIHCCVTSPPYFGLRSYLPSDHPGKAREGGTQETPEQYVQWLVEVFRGVWRVLRDDGTLWLNLGDSYAAQGGPQIDGTKQVDGSQVGAWNGRSRKPSAGLKAKDLLMIPARVALALQADGWWLRQEIVWAKDSAMPESVRDRCTRAHEFIYMLTKKPRYFYDAEAIKERAENNRWGPDGERTATNREGNGELANGKRFGGDTIGRNARSVWRINPKPYPGSHYATFPPELPLRCIKAGTSEHGVCSECGAPWRRVIERTAEPANGHKGSHFDKGKTGGCDGRDRTQPGERFELRSMGFEPTCSCLHPLDPTAGPPHTTPAIVLDPFSGSGTTGLAARKLGRRSVLIDLDDRNVRLLEQRMVQGVLC